MKAKTIDNTPYGWDSLIFDDSDQIIGSWIKGFHDKKVVDKCTELFNRELSAHVAKETEKLQAEVSELKAEVDRLKSIGHTPESEMNELSKEELIERLSKYQAEVDRLRKENDELWNHVPLYDYARIKKISKK